MVGLIQFAEMARDKPAGCGEWSKMEVKRYRGSVNGAKLNKHKVVTERVQPMLPPWHTPDLLVQGRMEHRNQEVREVRGIVVHLEPAHHTMIRKVLRHPRFRYAQVIR
jgi:hypothetical protein